MIGYLNLEGELIECKHFEHLDKARELCYQLYGKDFFIRQDAEDYLLDMGYIVIRRADVFINYTNSESGEYIRLTQAQFKFLIDNADKFNAGQKGCISDIMYDLDYIEKYGK